MTTPTKQFTQAIDDVRVAHASLDNLQGMLERDAQTGAALLLDGPRLKLLNALSILNDLAPMIEDQLAGFYPQGAE